TRARTVTATVVPRTTIVAERPRPSLVLRMNALSGISKTSAAKMPRKTTRRVSRTDTTAASRATTPAAASRIRHGTARDARVAGETALTARPTGALAAG